MFCRRSSSSVFSQYSSVVPYRPQASVKMRRYWSSYSTPEKFGLWRGSVKASAFSLPVGVWHASQRGS